MEFAKKVILCEKRVNNLICFFDKSIVSLYIRVYKGGGMPASVTIMIVDDSRIMRNTVKGVFSGVETACNFIEAKDGEEALALLETQPIDLILLDWNMPRLSGIDFLKQIRAMEKYKDLPIIMVTSEAAKFNVIEALKNGATDYITKPIKLDLFKQKLAKLRLFRM
jgi:two-component system chemotaxis response regulator CheY